jgi:helix-turn-helix protein
VAKIDSSRSQVERFTATDPNQLTIPGFDRYVDTQTLADILQVSRRTIENWVWRKKIPYLAISKRCCRFKLRDVLRSLEDRYTVHEISPSKKGGAAA